MKKLIEDMRNASAQAVGGTAFLDRHTLELAANQIEQMQSHMESLEKDAARYRVVRDPFSKVDFSNLYLEELDATIDAAMQS